MLGTQHKAPREVAESSVIKIVGREPDTPDSRVKHSGTGAIIYQCVEVVDGKTRGPWFAVGSDELEKWAGR